MLRTIHLIVISFILTIVVIGCQKKDDDPVSSSSIQIQSLEAPVVALSTGTTFRVSCKASGSGPVQYHWSAGKGGSGYNPVNSEVRNSFNHGAWAEWVFYDSWAGPAKGKYTVSVTAFTSDGVGSGSARNYYTYDAYGNHEKTYSFYESEEGRTWATKSIEITLN